LSTLSIDTAAVFLPLLEPARHKGAYGGRGSGKSHFFAGSIAEDALRFPGDAGEGLRAICGREIQKSLKDSAKFLIESKIAEYGLGEADGFKIFNDRIVTPKDGVIVFQGLQDHTTDSIKSFEGFHRFWGEEAHSISKRSIGLIRPTIRWESKRLGLQSEMWWSWNPSRKGDAVDQMLRGPELPTGAAVVKANWSDNPWFPDVLEQERTDCLRATPEQYDHIWEGGYATVLEGAYYASALITARQENRIGKVAKDPLMQMRAFFDIGVRDATAIWIAQFVGREIRVLDYYEAIGQPLSTHLEWMRSSGYGNALCVLPHDGSKADQITAIRYEDAIREAGFEVETIQNQGKGAAMKRVEASRRLFPSIWFNEPTTAPGLDALGWYHEKKDEARNIGHGPEHDWSSHGADAFGLMCVAYEEPREKRTPARPRASAGGWMG
tara:strand:- start:271 stop:1584 length:1314 start_codon:yes stop_codon:yes gene_type:complete